MTRNVISRMQHLYLANAFTALILGKFALLLGSDIVFGRDDFGRYALINGLIAAVFMCASMRARILVLSQIEHWLDFTKIRILLVFLGLTATGFCLAAGLTHIWLILFLAIAAQKVFENLMLAQAGFEQRQSDAPQAFARLNTHGALVLVAFGLGLIWSLELALAMELLVIAGTLAGQNRSRQEKSRSRPIGLTKIAQFGFGFTLVASLNAGLVSLFLFYALRLDPNAALVIAKIFAIQAIPARFLTGNILYFTQSLNQVLRLNWSLLVALAMMSLCIMGIAVTMGMSIWITAASFTVLNAIAILYRQQFLIERGPKQLIYLHVIELVLMWGVFLVTSDVWVAFLAFGAVRFGRIAVLGILFRTHQKSAVLA